MTRSHDKETLAFYDREAPAFARHQWPAPNPQLEAFLGSLAPGVKILELGCGGGGDAEFMLEAGFDVTPTDGSSGLAAQAALRLGRPVRTMLFEELDVDAAYDAVWANACLLHVPEDALPDVLSRIWWALRRGGLFFASYKAGDGGCRDLLGRYNNLVNRVGLEASYKAVGPWSELSIAEAQGGGYDGVARTWLLCTAKKA